ncbi:hypothetical protein HNQ08_004439 [Deinococcus humi]|uniref:Uncharacterized protein n=1 Tax=Deinococcus humi TaxID=662880 RepID=A0A7W8JYT4_9DEIO|nr:hypothetical protein [Deinococcus humi]
MAGPGRVLQVLAMAVSPPTLASGLAAGERHSPG